ncbi:MAG: sigma-70 family RNA polymerase sigma factor, partial [Phycisphaerales bacterium]|nr:sigma-70 family RNA polymerase sigma factor [Phycisphaerales bacterium]
TESSPTRRTAPAEKASALSSRKEPRRAVPETLLERIGNGDTSAVRECLDRFSGLIWALARRAGLSGAEAEDSVQEIFVEIWKSAGRYRPEIASETAFVATIARRRLIDARRRKTRRPPSQVLHEDAATAAPISDRAEVAQEADRATRALERLSAEQQRVLRLSVFEGLSHEKIATATGLPLGTVKTHARRGLIKIRAMLGVESGSGGESSGSPASTTRAAGGASGGRKEVTR